MTADPTALIHRAADMRELRTGRAAALAEVALWRGIAERHKVGQPVATGHGDQKDSCRACDDWWPCPDLLAVHAAAAAYLGETT